MSGTTIKNKGGRPKGSKNKKVSIRDYMTTHEIIEFVSWLKKNYKNDTRLAIFMGEQLFGKAPQAVSLSAETQPIIIIPSSATNRYMSVEREAEVMKNLPTPYQ